MTIVLFILEAAAVTAFFSSGPASFALLAPVGVAAMFLLARGCALLLSRKTGRTSKALDPGIVIALSPACLLFLKHLSAAVFLMDIRGYLVPLAAAGTIVLLSTLFAENRRPAETARTAPHRQWLWLFLVSFAANAFFASGFVFPPHPLTGDEPHYLLITKSLIDDGDINLYNNTVQEDHRRFYPGVMETHAKAGKGGPGTLYSRHLPGLSILLLPFYALADRMESLSAFVFIVRLPICLLTALLGAMFFLFALDLTGSRRAATAAWCVFSFSAPVFFYSSLIYPEVPAALIAILAFRALFTRPKAGPAALLLSGAGIGLLPWFSAKYAVLSIVLFILAAAPRLKKSRSSRRELFHLSAAPAVLGLLYLFFLRSTYGHFNPVAVYSGAAAPQTLSAGLPWKAANVREFVSAGLAVFFEQKAGILVYAPVYLLAGAGLFLLWRKKRAAEARLLAIFGAFWILSAASYYLGGYCPPGRPLLPVMWIPAGFVALALAEPSKRFSAVIKSALAGLSLIIVLVSLSTPGLLYHTNVNPRRGNMELESRFLSAAGNLLFDPVKWAPSLNASASLNAWPLAAWILLAALLTFIYSRPRSRPPGEGRLFTPASRAAIVLAASLLVLAFAFIRVHLDPRTACRTEAGEWFFQDENQYGPESSGFWTKGSREAVVVLRSPVRLSVLIVGLTSAAAGEAEVRADRYRRTIRHDPHAAARNDLVFPEPSGLRWRGGYLYVIGVRERRPFVPYLLDRSVQDNRTLGVFVEIGGRQ